MHLKLPPPSFRLLPLALCAAALLLCGCGGKKPTKEQAITQYSRELHDAVADQVRDEGRRVQMLALVDRLESLQLRFAQDTEALVASYRKLDADYGASRAAFEQLFADYNATRIRARGEALDLHFQLAALATEEEWRPIARAESHLYEAVSTARAADEPR
ncbi:MAG: hypothetical protein JSR36_13115 [Proteobacteria bacterium]|nr:hypothetical protein [Pseudomonadota bacterium]